METIQKEDLQLLSEILKERLVAEIPDSQEFEVKCGIKNDELVILTTHPSGITVNTKQIFSVLEQALQWQFHYQTERVQFFIRSLGDKRPYDKYIADFSNRHLQNIEEIQLLDEPILAEEPQIIQEFPPPEEQIIQDFSQDKLLQEEPQIIFPPRDLESHLKLDGEPLITDSSSSNIDNSEPPLFFNPFGDNDGQEPNINHNVNDYSNQIIYTPDGEQSLENKANNEEEEKFDPFANIPQETRKKPFALPFPPLPVLLGSFLVVAMISGGGMFVLYRGCAISECQELQNGQKLKNDYPQKIKSIKSEKDLPVIQQQLETSITELKTIPSWSPKSAQSQELITSFTQSSAKLGQVIKALSNASAAEKTATTPVKSLDELRERQKQWRQAITLLEAIKPTTEGYDLVKSKLPTYQNGLKAVNQQIVKEETWFNKLGNAKKAGEAAISLQATAKSPQEWQKVESGIQGAINVLKTIPVDSLGHEETQKLLNEYQPKWIIIRDRSKKEKDAATAYQEAIKAANLAKGLGTQNQYKAAVKAWQTALQNAKNVTEDSFYYKQATILVESYSVSLKDAEQQLEMFGDLTETRNQLNTTCTSSIKICTFTVNNQGISVRLTTEYDQRLQGNSQEMQNHFRTLQEALSVISTNANLPVVLTNSKGEERYMKKPQ